jgi:hypothetical protein
VHIRRISLIAITVIALGFYSKASFAGVVTGQCGGLSKQAVSTFSLVHGTVIMSSPKVAGTHGHSQGSHGHSQGGHGRSWWGGLFSSGTCFTRCRQSHSPKYCHARCG